MNLENLRKARNLVDELSQAARKIEGDSFWESIKTVEVIIERALHHAEIEACTDWVNGHQPKCTCIAKTLPTVYKDIHQVGCRLYHAPNNAVSVDLLTLQINKLNFDTTAAEQPPTSSDAASG